MEYEIVCRDAFAVAGVRRVTSEAGGVWGQLRAEGGLEALRCLAGPGSPLLGLCFGFDEKGENDNMVGFLLRGEAPEGCEVCRYPACRWFVVTAEGKISDLTLRRAWRWIHRELIDDGVICPRDAPTIEEYELWDEAADRCRVKLRVPVY